LLSVLLVVKEYFLQQVYPRFIILLKAPVVHPEMIWIVIPLFVTLLLMEFYFGRYRQEELGWNTAFGNAIVLLFVAIDLFRHIYTNPITLANLSTTYMKTLVACLVGVEALWLMFLDYFHFLPKKVAFFISSALPNNVTAYVAIAIVYSTVVPFDMVTILAAVLFFFILYGFFRLVRWTVPEVKIEKTVRKKSKHL